MGPTRLRTPLLALGLVLLAATAATRPAVAADALPADTWREQVLQALNGVRRSQGLADLQLAPELLPIAQGHSDDMAARRRLSHDGFDARMDRSGSLLCVENVAAGTTRPAVLLGAWTRAPVHRQNLLEPRVRRAAVAVTGTASSAYVTLFACE